MSKILLTRNQYFCSLKEQYDNAHHTHSFNVHTYSGLKIIRHQCVDESVLCPFAKPTGNSYSCGINKDILYKP